VSNKARIIPLPLAASSPKQVAANLVRLASEVGVTLGEIVATADANGIELPPAVRRAAASLDDRLPGIESEPDLSSALAQFAVTLNRLITSRSNELAAPDLGDTSAPSKARPEETLNRMEFIQAMLGVAGAAAVGRFDDSGPLRLGSGDVARCRTALARLYELDDRQGGSGYVYGLTVRSARQMRRLLNDSVYDEPTGKALFCLMGEVTEHAGWLAYDAGRHAEARYWWLEAQHASQIAGSPAVATVVFASMALQASRLGQGQAAIDTARAARRAVKPVQTPRLLSVLHAREALGYARTGDRRRAWRALERAESLAGAERRENDPPWLDFWGQADLACHRMHAAIDLGEAATATKAARAAVAAVDPVAYPRNYALYSAYLADVLVTQRAVDEAVPVAARAIASTSDIDSARILAQVASVLRKLSPYQDNKSVRELLAWAPTVLRSSPQPA
jgi:tetratricopeptide (TPR) repeat protein